MDKPQLKENNRSILCKIEDGILLTLLVGLIVLSFIEVILRVAFDYGPSGLIEHMSLLIVWLTFFGASVAVREKSHIRLDILTKFLPKKIKKICDQAVYLLSAIILVYFIGAFAEYLKIFIEGADTVIIPFTQTQVETWKYFLIIPLSLGLMIVRSLYFFIIGFSTGEGSEERSNGA